MAELRRENRRLRADAELAAEVKTVHRAYQVRTWRAWYAHVTLSMPALAWLAASRAQSEKRAGEPGMIGYPLPEIRRLLTSLIQWHAPPRGASGPGPAGTDDASSRPGSAITGDEATPSHKCRPGLRQVSARLSRRADSIEGLAEVFGQGVCDDYEPVRSPTVAAWNGLTFSGT